MKYIDAEKLIEMIDNSIAYCQINYSDDYALGFEQSLHDVKNFINSLQQEQSELSNEFEIAINRRLNLINGENLTATELLEETKGMAAELLDLARKVIEKGQSDVDLEKEIEKYFDGWYDHATGVGLNANGESLNVGEIIDIARHFAEWGAIHLNTRKEE